MGLVKREWIGHEFAPVRAELDRPRLRAFAKSINETDATYSDPDAARAAGFRDLPAPPTYLFCLEMLDAPNPFYFLEDLGVDITRILHGEQSFEYLSSLCAGDRVIFRGRVADVYEKKGGALGFIVQDTEVSHEDGRVAARLRRVIVVRGS
jgi:plasmid stabilization system protein ParE